MPPPRRRRPVQPATRVRLPRSARPGTAPTADTAAAATPVAGSGVIRAGLVQTEDPPASEAPVSEAALAGEVPADETLAGETLGGEAPAGDAEDLDEETRAEDESGEAEPAEDEPTAKPAVATAERSPLLLPAILGAAAVTLGSLAIWFGVAASSTGSGVDTQNTALIDSAATAQVNQQVDKAFTTVFSYNYADTAKTLQAARTLLTGNAVGEYQTLFKVVEQEAPKEKLVLTTTVTSSGVETLSGNTARVLIFANQQDTSASHSATDAGAMLAINAVRLGGQWKISSIDTFSPGG